MINIDDYKNIKDGKELIDIALEYNKTEQLLKNKDSSALQQHLSEVLRKHWKEVAIYNLGKVKTPESDLPQQGINCMNFLENLLREKSAEKALKKHNE